mmetsp:Transcript_1867/g.2626  ORF Transcript_1867/g.2626 Transcript_1867/m.2626 type:complete len:147 (-) Transcript_1867:147-587(-)
MGKVAFNHQLRFLLGPLPALLFSCSIGAAIFGWWGATCYSSDLPFFVKIFLVFFVFVEGARTVSGGAILISGTHDVVASVFSLTLIALVMLIAGTLTLIFEPRSDSVDHVWQMVLTAWAVVFSNLIVTVIAFCCCVASIEAKKRRD